MRNTDGLLKHAAIRMGEANDTWKNWGGDVTPPIKETIIAASMECEIKENSKILRHGHEMRACPRGALLPKKIAFNLLGKHNFKIAVHFVNQDA